MSWASKRLNNDNDGGWAAKDGYLAAIESKRRETKCGKVAEEEENVIDFSSKSFIRSELGKKGIRGEQRLFILKPLRRINWRGWKR